MTDKQLTYIKTVGGIDINYDPTTQKFSAIVEDTRIAFKDMRLVEKRIRANQHPIRAIYAHNYGCIGHQTEVVDVVNWTGQSFKGYGLKDRPFGGRRYTRTWDILYHYDPEIVAALDDIAKRMQALCDEYETVMHGARRLYPADFKKRDAKEG